LSLGESTAPRARPIRDPTSLGKLVKQDRRLRAEALHAMLCQRPAHPTAAAGTVARDAPICARCNTLSQPGDTFCGLCGSPLGGPAPVATRPAPSATPATLAGYSARNQERILDACPSARDGRTFHSWLAAGRVVMKGQKGVKIVAPDEIDGGKVTRIQHMHVFDVTQTQERTPRAAIAA
jgi:hypothetical protein